MCVRVCVRVYENVWMYACVNINISYGCIVNWEYQTKKENRNKELAGRHDFRNMPLEDSGRMSSLVCWGGR